MKTRRKKRLRYNGNILRRARMQRLFQSYMDAFAAKCRARMASQVENAWLGLAPANPPSGCGPVLTKLLLDNAADALGVPHP